MIQVLRIDPSSHTCSQCGSGFNSNGGRNGPGWFPSTTVSTVMFWYPCSTWALDGVLCPNCYQKKGDTEVVSPQDGGGLETLPPMPRRTGYLS